LQAASQNNYADTEFHTSMWVKRELLFALQQDRFENRIIPILLQPCKFDQLSCWVLPSFQIIDFEKPLDEGFRDLLKIWGLGYQPKA